MEFEKIQEVVPIVKPVLCIDDICEIDYGKEVIGYKNVCDTEEWASAHFKGQPVLPGTMIVETMGQIASFMFYNPENPVELKAYVVKLDKVRFKKLVEPNCRLYVHAKFIGRAGRLVKMHCVALVGDEEVASAEITEYFIHDIFK